MALVWSWSVGINVQYTMVGIPSIDIGTNLESDNPLLYKSEHETKFKDPSNF